MVSKRLPISLLVFSLCCLLVLAACKARPEATPKRGTRTLYMNSSGAAAGKRKSVKRIAAPRFSAAPKPGYRKSNNFASSSTATTTSSNASTKYSANSVADVPDEDPIAEAGLLTATEINDFQKWDLWKDISETDLKGNQFQWQMYARHRYTVQLTNEDIIPLVDADVILQDRNGKALWKTKTDNRGMAELWPNFFDEKNPPENGLTIKATYQGQTVSTESPLSFKEGINFMTMPASCTPPSTLDIAFVVDATGSMGDEIDYLKTDLAAVLDSTAKKHSDLTLRFGTLFYKCPGNDYITEKVDFNTNTKKGLNFIQTRSADGGGLESVEVALQETVEDMAWSEEARARLLFLVLDETPGATDSILTQYHQTIRSAAAKGIHIIPVVASGIDLIQDRLLEYLMRTTALATNGTCAFLTDDSGIGNDHTEPVTDEMKVEILGDLLLRLIDQYVDASACEAPLALEKIAPDTTWVPVELITEVDSTGDNPEDVAQIEEVEEGGSNKGDEGEPAKTGFRFFPNPTTGPLTVEIQGDIKEVFIADMSGKVLLRLDPGEQKRIQTDLSKLPAGTYLVRYLEKDRIRGDRLVLMH